MGSRGVPSKKQSRLIADSSPDSSVTAVDVDDDAVRLRKSTPRSAAAARVKSSAAPEKYEPIDSENRRPTKAPPSKELHEFTFGADRVITNVKRTMLDIMDATGTRHEELSSNIDLKLRRHMLQPTKKAAPKKFLHVPSSTGSDFKTANGGKMDRTVHKVFGGDSESDASQPTTSTNAQNIVRAVVPSAAGKSLAGIGPKKLNNAPSGAYVKPTKNDSVEEPKGLVNEPSLKNFDPNIIELIESEIMSVTSNINWGDVAGLEAAKKALFEIVVLPFKRPDVFKGIRTPPKGVLLFGPPGTGKTMIGRCVASQCRATFFNISASSLTSKWVGEGEKLVRALFAVARLKDPSVIFIDEIDSLLCARSETEHESSRRIKTEFLVQLDGIATTSEERLLVLGATNRPQELDEAARRRFAKRLYVPLPEKRARSEMVRHLLRDNDHIICDRDLDEISNATNGYSGADMRNLCSEAAMGPIRDIVNNSAFDIETVPAEHIRAISIEDFRDACKVVPRTVMKSDLKAYHEWDAKFGCLPRTYSEYLDDD